MGTPQVNCNKMRVRKSVCSKSGRSGIPQTTAGPYNEIANSDAPWTLTLDGLHVKGRGMPLGTSAMLPGGRCLTWLLLLLGSAAALCLSSVRTTALAKCDGGGPPLDGPGGSMRCTITIGRPNQLDAMGSSLNWRTRREGPRVSPPN